MEKSTAPLDFAASFPPDARFAPTAGELAARLAQTSGCAECDSQGIREAVDAAFQQALTGCRNGDGAPIEVALHSNGASFAMDVTCGARTLLHLTHPRSA